MGTCDVIAFQAPERLRGTDDVTTLQAPERLRRLIRPFCGGKEVGESLRLMGSAFLANAELD